MISLTPFIEGRVRNAALLIALGLLVQVISLTILHPLAFVAFVVLGCPLVLAGIVLFLFSLANLSDAA